MARSTGLGTASMELLRPTAPPAEPPDDPNPIAPQDDAEGRGDQAPESRQPSKRPPSGRPASTGKTKARNLHLSDDVHDRLWLLARQRRTTVSAVANDLLDKALPRWKMEREG